MYHLGDLSKVTKWDSSKGMFGDWLFFGSDESVSGTNNGSILYTLKDDAELNEISASQIEYEHDIRESESAMKVVAYVACIADCDEEKAVEYLTEEDFYFGDAETCWLIQKSQADLAKCFGYDCVKVSDEHGKSYMIDMIIHFENLIEA